jgi:hypothetical protein
MEERDSNISIETLAEYKQELANLRKLIKVAPPEDLPQLEGDIDYYELILWEYRY